jgi:hypothetical protein
MFPPFYFHNNRHLSASEKEVEKRFERLFVEILRQADGILNFEVIKNREIFLKLVSPDWLKYDTRIAEKQVEVNVLAPDREYRALCGAISTILSGLQLQRDLQNETGIFREFAKMLHSDDTYKVVHKKHLKILGFIQGRELEASEVLAELSTKKVETCRSKNCSADETELKTMLVLEDGYQLPKDIKSVVNGLRASVTLDELFRRCVTDHVYQQISDRIPKIQLTPPFPPFYVYATRDPLGSDYQRMNVNLSKETLSWFGKHSVQFAKSKGLLKGP